MSSIDAYNHGVTNDLNQNYQAAIKCYTKATIKDPHYAKAYNNLGTALVNVGYYDEAITNYTKALICDPYNGDIYTNNISNVYLKLAQYSYLLGYYQDAIDKYTLAIERKPKNKIAEKIKNMGYEYVELKDIYYNRALAKEAIGLSNCGDYKKACELGDVESCNLFESECE
jgi:tetratricopeptide (TPR) repeat protein